jgi:hypothetical protein
LNDKPHYIDGKPASTEEIVPVIMQHVNHAGIAFFPSCPECQKDDPALAANLLAKS